LTLAERTRAAPHAEPIGSPGAIPGLALPATRYTQSRQRSIAVCCAARKTIGAYFSKGVIFVSE